MTIVENNTNKKHTEFINNCLKDLKDLEENELELVQAYNSILSKIKQLEYMTMNQLNIKKV